MGEKGYSYNIILSHYFIHIDNGFNLLENQCAIRDDVYYSDWNYQGVESIQHIETITSKFHVERNRMYLNRISDQIKISKEREKIPNSPEYWVSSSENFENRIFRF